MFLTIIVHCSKDRHIQDIHGLSREEDRGGNRATQGKPPSTTGNRGGSAMSSEMPNDKELYGHLGCLANEILGLKPVFQTIASLEVQIKSIFDQVANLKAGFANRTAQMEMMMKEVAASAVEDAEREEEIKKGLELEKASLETQLRETEELLRAKEAAMRDLEDKLTLKMNELERQLREKAKHFEIRHGAQKDAGTTTGSSNVPAESLICLSDEQVIFLQEADEKTDEEADGPGTREKNIAELVGRMTAEIEKLKAEIRKKDVILGAKEMEMTMMKQSMEAKVKELESPTRNPGGGKRTVSRLVSYFVETRRNH